MCSSPLSKEMWEAVNGPPVSSYGYPAKNGSTPSPSGAVDQPQVTQEPQEKHEPQQQKHATPDERPTQFSGKALLAMELREPNFVVPDLLPEGECILGGKPKMGKSWLALQICIAVATGGMVLGSIPVIQGDALYLALEDNPRRLQGRLKKLLQVEGELGQPGLDEQLASLEALTLATEWPRSDKGGLAKLEVWLQDHPGARLVVIDTFARFKARVRSSGSQYEDDYASTEGLQALASKYGVAILIITHLRKMEASDPLDTLNATMGLSGGADSILILKRERGRADATLFVSGRDVKEQELALKWDADIASWSVIGEADAYRYSQARRDVLETLKKASKPLTPKEVADLLGKNHSAVKKLMWEMAGETLLINQGGTYQVKAREDG